MSKLLSSLTQSESHRSAQPLTQGRAGGTADYRSTTSTRSSWRMAALCFAIPVIGVSVYAGIYAQGETPAQSPLNRAAATDLVVSTQAPVISPSVSVDGVLPASLQPTPRYPVGIEHLSYPTLYTEALPRLQSGSNRYTMPQASLSPSVASQASDAVKGREASVPELKTVPSKADSWDLEEIDYSQLSPEIASHLRSAIAATKGDDEPLPQLLQEEREGEDVSQRGSEPEPIAIGELPATVQNRIPTLNFQTHIYSSTPDSRWVKVNGKEAFEGDEIAPGVVLRQIKPRTVVFDFDSYLVSMPALSEW
ncbi:general secretion pathway protein GspB [Photobacterium nomapromontoriensis]|uniref:general secretion pathway protein GspB n=1 Tax=Photobacterium nomapromontoriensis TaxID=2910237 RepID=UPI003D100C2D